ncbi:hypothetical protein ABMA28_001410 [Loxostege sticticalis]|uniref:Uncharacterized protein n=1 Tax=Loxostege sticticalis TaxID=481309 RepID=A0ABD0T5P9_LOXSC
MNLVISEVHSTQAATDNLSDDDVIEVVRDEAPIEILSDGEETELQNKNLSQLADVMQDFHFTSVPSTGDGDQCVDPKEAEDPLSSKTCDKITEELCEAITNNMKTIDGKSNENKPTPEPEPDISKISLESVEKNKVDPGADTTERADNVTVPESTTKESADDK